MFIYGKNLILCVCDVERNGNRQQDRDIYVKLNRRTIDDKKRPDMRPVTGKYQIQ